MTTLTRSSKSPLGSACLDRVVNRPDAERTQSAVAGRTKRLTVDEPGLLVKRAVDVAGAFVGLVLLSPVLVASALFIRLDSPGPVLFRQVRRGGRGQPFRMLKFRTMVVDAEQRLGDLESCNESAGGVLFKLRDDPRVTRLGRFLRRSSLDELPQLINVLRGEMSLVGPRPLQLRDSERLRAVDPMGYASRLQVLPGLTGPWQVGGRSDLDYDQMVRLDLDYVSNRSLGRDLGILGKTLCRGAALPGQLLKPLDIHPLAGKTGRGQAARMNEELR